MTKQTLAIIYYNSPDVTKNFIDVSPDVTYCVMGK